MKKYIIILLIIMLLIGFTVCQTRQPLSYDKFTLNFKNFKNDFISENFILISPKDSLVITTASLPENSFDDRKTDALNDNLGKPTRYELYYKEKNTDLLVKVNFIYTPHNKTKKFLSLSSITPARTSNIIATYEDIPRPLLDEFLIQLEGYLVSITFIETNINPNMKEYEKQTNQFYRSIISFYNDFDKYLLKTEK